MGKRKYEPTTLDRARDELFSHIQRCGVLEAEEEQRFEWLSDTVEYLAERYPDLGREELAKLRTMGERYCSPAIPHGEKVASDVWDDAAEGGEKADTTTETTGEVSAA
ncbi:MAG: hypothetical protein ACRELC_08520 [Gemmatimonadota bacterium]